jgi:N-acetylmuramoyl-L-alanine amidase
LAREVAADLYISIHNNSFNNPTAGGFETFTHSGPLFEPTLQYQRIIHDLLSTYIRGLGVRDRGMKRADHWVTRNMHCPTVLIEYMFVSNPQEAALLQRTDVLKRLGEISAVGIADCLKLPAKSVYEPPKDDGVWYRVIAGSYRVRSNADAVLATLQAQGIKAFIEVKRDA